MTSVIVSPTKMQPLTQKSWQSVKWFLFWSSNLDEYCSTIWDATGHNNAFWLRAFIFFSLLSVSEFFSVSLCPLTAIHPPYPPVLLCLSLYVLFFFFFSPSSFYLLSLINSRCPSLIRIYCFICPWHFMIIPPLKPTIRVLKIPNRLYDLLKCRFRISLLIWNTRFAKRQHLAD